MRNITNAIGIFIPRQNNVIHRLDYICICVAKYIDNFHHAATNESLPYCFWSIFLSFLVFRFTGNYSCHIPTSSTWHRIFTILQWSDTNKLVLDTKIFTNIFVSVALINPSRLILTFSRALGEFQISTVWTQARYSKVTVINIIELN